MRQQTCVRLPPDLLRSLKIRAIDEGTNVNSLIERAVRNLLSGTTSEMPKPSIMAPAKTAIPCTLPPAENGETGNAFEGLRLLFLAANEE
jgi:Ribbon-helix-helix protein, copG family